MNYNVENLISIFTKLTNSKTEMGEQETTSGGDTKASAGGTVPQWADVVGGPKRGHANPTDSTIVWNTGLVRGVANQIY